MEYKSKDKVYLSKLGRGIRRIRQEKGFSQERLGFDCGIHRTYISSVERGQRNIAILNLRKIALALQVPLGHLIPK